MTDTFDELFSITVSDPWRLFDENHGNIKVPIQKLVALDPKRWIVALTTPATLDSKDWSFAVLLNRYVGAVLDDVYSLKEGESVEVNIVFISKARADALISSPELNGVLDGPGGIGSLMRHP